jgi:hypothetical protein
MKKHLSLTIIALLLALLLVGLTVPKIIGLIVSASEPELRLREMTGQQELSLTLDQGWFRGSASVRVKDPVFAGVRYENQEINTDMVVTHGPFMWTSQGLRFGLAWIELVPHSNNPEINALFTNLNISAQSPLTLLVKANGSLQTSLPRREVNFSRAAEFTGHSNLRAQLDMAPSGLATLDIEATEFLIEGLEGLVSSQSIALRLQTERLDQAAIPGSIGIDIRELQISGQESLTIDRISLEYSAFPEQEGGTFALKQQVYVGNLVSELAVTDLNWFTSITNIDAELANNYIQFVRENAATGFTESSAAQQQRLAEFTQTSTLLLVQHPISMQSTLSLEAYDGHHEAELAIDWPGLPSIRSTQTMPFAQALVALNATLGLKADAIALERTPIGATVNMYIGQGVLQVTQGIIELNASLTDGTISFNNQTIALKPFLDL